MNGGTSLRAEGTINRRAESSIMALTPRPAGETLTLRPAVAAFRRSFLAGRGGATRTET
jgi:hypothetical protein